MRLTVYSLVMAICSSDLLILLLYASRKKTSFLRQFGVYNIVLVYLLCIFRLVLPVEFPFVRIINLEWLMNPIIERLGYQITPPGGMRIYVKDILLFLWFFVAAVQFFRFLRKYLKYQRRFSSIILIENDQTARVFQRVKAHVKQHGRGNPEVTICYSDRLSGPAGIGILHEKILLQSGSYSDEELFYILLHEYTHFLNRDLTVKMLVQFFCCVFWWNPIAYLLQKDLDQILEMKCDLNVTESLSKPEIARYLQTIVNQLKRQKAQITNYPQTKGTAAFLGNRKKYSVEERFRHVLDHERNRKKTVAAQVIIFIFTVLVFLASYLFVVQASFHVPIHQVEGSNSVLFPNAEEMRIMKLEDGSYLLVIGDVSYEISEEEMQEFLSEGVPLMEY